MRSDQEKNLKNPFYGKNRGIVSKILLHYQNSSFIFIAITSRFSAKNEFFQDFQIKKIEKILFRVRQHGDVFGNKYPGPSFIDPLKKSSKWIICYKPVLRHISIVHWHFDRLIGVVGIKQSSLIAMMHPGRNIAGHRSRFREDQNTWMVRWLVITGFCVRRCWTFLARLRHR